MALLGKKKISASEVAEMFLESLGQTLSEYWPEMARKLSPSVQIPVNQLTSDEAFGNVYMAIASTHYHDLPKLFDENATDSLRRSIWYGITRHDYSLGDVLRGYLRAMESADEEGELYLSVAAAVLYEKLGGDFIVSTDTHKLASPTATMALTELFMVFDLDWWKQLQSEFKVVA